MAGMMLVYDVIPTSAESHAEIEDSVAQQLDGVTRRHYVAAEEVGAVPSAVPFTVMGPCFAFSPFSPLLSGGGPAGQLS